MIDFYKNKKIFITGHSGFKGTWLCLYLIRLKAKIYGYSLPPEENALYTKVESYLKENINQSFSNILDSESLSEAVKKFEPDIIFHLAAQPLVRKSYVDPIETWQTNLIGSLNLLNCLKNYSKKCAVVVVTTDKVYLNQEWDFGYRENDILGGNDPYSASKAALEIAIASWRFSFCGSEKHQNKNVFIATARAGNVIGGGDMAEDRIVPDSIRALIDNKKIPIRNPKSTRPWQHVLEPLNGYLELGMKLYSDPKEMSSSFNFGPYIKNNTTVEKLVIEILSHWPGDYELRNKNENYHESNLLHLQIDKVYKYLNWSPKWDFELTIEKTINWYKRVFNGASALEMCNLDIDSYENKI
tara:strand:- start:588 stop:1655 length:1068 start_codon:yes stop_codon:yes gene_type:complete